MRHQLVTYRIISLPCLDLKKPRNILVVGYLKVAFAFLLNVTNDLRSYYNQS